MPTAAAIGGGAILGAISGDRSSKRAAKAQKDASATADARIREATAAARRDAIPLLSSAEKNNRLAAQSVLDIFSGAIPAQMQVAQGGNVGAQQALLAGLPQMYNAILGNQVDFSGFKPVQLQAPEAGFFSHQLPQFSTITDALGGAAQQGAGVLQRRDGGGRLGGERIEDDYRTDILRLLGGR